MIILLDRGPSSDSPSFLHSFVQKSLRLLFCGNGVEFSDFHERRRRPAVAAGLSRYYTIPDEAGWIFYGFYCRGWHKGNSIQYTACERISNTIYIYFKPNSEIARFLQHGCLIVLHVKVSMHIEWCVCVCMFLNSYSRIKAHYFITKPMAIN